MLRWLVGDGDITIECGLSTERLEFSPWYCQIFLSVPDFFSTNKPFCFKTS